MILRTLPKPGDLIRKDYGPKNANTWKCWARVRAIVDARIVCCRYLPGKRYHCWLVVDPYEWALLGAEFRHRTANGKRDIPPKRATDEELTSQKGSIAEDA